MVRFRVTHKRGLFAFMAVAVALSTGGCREDALKRGPGEAGSQAAGLSPKQAALVLAKVGDYPITLGEYAATLERMDQFDRLRYKTPERRRELLEEMITVELLAREAERRGLDKEPQTQEALRQVLRDAILRDARMGARGPAEIKEDEVRAYYEANKDQYMEPERRRVSHVVVSDRKKAEELLGKAKGISDMEAWGKFVLGNSEEYKGKEYTGPVETAGDLGLVGPPGDRRGANPRIDEELRASVFLLANVGDVVDRVVTDGEGKFHIVRLIGVTKAHARSFAEAERTIRILMSQQEVAVREQQLEEELRAKFPITIDEAALADAKIPVPTEPLEPLPRLPGKKAPQPPNPGGHGHDHGHDHAH
ncbi:MAG: peptidylprolyl isomerase [Coriobacteriia bacterium]|jgi:parvulin-like peptidyl-prolyl isomerase|nr:peptidylprolyl isomerase [Coriobacteriia bacterium]